MVEAVRTTTSTFGIWAIIVVAVICLAFWLVGISVADNIQVRESRLWRRLRESEPEPAVGGEGAPEVPGQRRGDERVAERPAAGQEAAAGHEGARGNRRGATLEAISQGLRSVLDHDLDPGYGTGAGHQAVAEPIPAQQQAPETETETETAAARGRHAKPTQPTQPTLDGAGDFRRDSAEADWRAEPPTRPDLPAQAAPAGRHAMPAQRTADTDRAERSLAAPDPASAGDDSGQE
ncbi:MAG: hypothetical protein ABSA02_08500 [Trebonia sp.]